MCIYLFFIHTLFLNSENSYNSVNSDSKKKDEQFYKLLNNFS